MYYCLQHGDIDRILRGYDFCGNICGVKNQPDTNFPCKVCYLINYYYFVLLLFLFLFFF